MSSPARLDVCRARSGSSHRQRFIAAVALAGIASLAVAGAQIVGPNVNMVSGTSMPDGDPFLQRQNEPSGAVSTRNPLHLLAGANDYRTVDIPGLPGDRATGDAWLGVFKSFDGGQTWKTTLVPGFPQDTSPAGLASPIKGYEAGADPTVRAGSHGLFFYSGLAFNRGTEALSALFVARFIDNNNAPGQDSIAYIDTRVIATGKKKEFIDKPVMIVDVPRAGAAVCSISAPGAPAVQRIPAGTIYVAYMAFEADALIDDNPTLPLSKLMVSRSTDCGATWTPPSVASERARTHQGVSLAIDPRTGTLFLAWREFANATSGDAILMTRTIDLGSRGRRDPDAESIKFTAPVAVAQITPFDQNDRSGTRFRTNSYPTLAIDAANGVYLAWSERGWGPPSSGSIGAPAIGDARVVLMAGRLAQNDGKRNTADPLGIQWTTRRPIDNHPGSGHQVMPAAIIAAGRLTIVYKDFRGDQSGVFGMQIDEAEIFQRAPPKRHTFDVWLAQAALTAGDPVLAPAMPVSRYLRGSRPGSRAIEQLQFNVPNLPLYAQGTTPFIGDYLDIAAETFVQDATGAWTYNSAPAGPGALFAFWTDNRDVRPPKDGNWRNYTPPISPWTGQPCTAGQTGMRNANIYGARISPGLFVGSPDNARRLSAIPKSFVVFAQNNTDQIRRFRFTIASQPPGGQASFLQFSPPGSPLTTLDATLAPRSSASRTVYVTSSDPTATVKVDVVEVEVPPTPTPFPPVIVDGLQGTIVLNPDVTNPDVTNPDVTNNEIFNPDVTNPDVTNPDVTNPDVTNPDVTNPDVTNVQVANPDVTNPGVTNPDVTNPVIANPDVTNPDVTNPDVTNGAYIDVTWTVINRGNKAGAFAVDTLLAKAAPAGFKLQLLLYKTYSTPITVMDDCALKTQTQTVLIANIVNPDVTNPDVTNQPSTGGDEPPPSGPAADEPAPVQIGSDVTDPSVKNATLWLEPGGSARITLRVLAPDRTKLVQKTVTQSNGVQQVVLVDPAFDPSTVASIAVTPQAVNTVDAQNGVTTPTPVIALVISTTSLPAGSVNTPFDLTLTAVGGTAPFTWSVVAGSGSLPAGLTLDSTTGRISGTPTVTGTFTFTVQVTDSASPPHVNTQTVTIQVTSPSSAFVVTTTADSGPGSLRQAMLDANAAPGLDTITFAIPGGGIQNIRPLSALPAITDPVVIDGTTQPGYAGTPLIEVDGIDDATLVANGFLITAGGSTIRGLAIGRFTNVGIRITAGGGNVIEGNFVGTDATGTVARANLTGGVIVFDSANNLFGGTTPGSANVISGNSFTGLLITGAASSGNQVVGNLVGTDVTGTAAIPNANAGVQIVAGSNNVVGGPTAAARNLISGGAINGVSLRQGATGNVIQGNYIGTDLSGTAALGNGSAGVLIGESSNNTVAGNLISGNNHGVLFVVQAAPNVATGNVIRGNLIGTDATGMIVIGNSSAGVAIGGGASGNVIGGVAPADQNVISGNLTGVRIADAGTSNNAIQGNHIGINAMGSAALGNTSDGVLIVNGATNNTIGGATAGAGNVISGNQFGMSISGAGTTGNLVQGNRIGTNPIGSSAIGNVTHGININTNASANVVGGQTPGAGNVVSGNRNGILILTGANNNVVEGNLIGFDVTGLGAIPNADNGIIINNAPSNTIGGTTIAARNVIANSTFNGVVITNAAAIGNTVQGNYIGLAAGGGAAPTPMANGLVVSAGASNNVIGGSAPGAGNVVSRNQTGIALSGVGTNGNLVLGNRVGTDASGLAAIGNLGIGVTLTTGAAGNIIGGSGAGAGNLISGNSTGLMIQSGANNNVVQGNLIGTDATGAQALPNTATGIALNAATSNTIGGATAGARNVISGNAAIGIDIINGADANTVQGNYIGLDVSGAFAIGNGGLGMSILTSNNIIGGTQAAARNVISGNGSHGLQIVSGGTGNQVMGNFIGTDASGAQAVANGGFGVLVSGAAGNTIGGTAPGSGNVISGNTTVGVGLSFTDPTGNVVQGNFIGTNAAGTAALPNGAYGVQIATGSHNLIGGTAVAARNVISGNAFGGIGMFVGSSTGNTIQGNFIGTDASGLSAIPNMGDGISLSDPGAATAPSGNTIGGPIAGAGNLISGNSWRGIGLFDGATANVIAGNTIGLSATGLALGNSSDGVLFSNAASGNTVGGTGAGAGNTIAFNGGHGVHVFSGTTNRVIGNAIFSNTTLGIDLGGNGVSANDGGNPPDSDSGANDLQNFPSLTVALGAAGLLTVSGSLASTPSTTFEIDVYANDACDPSGFGEGQEYVGRVSTTTDAGGAAAFSTGFAVTIAGGRFLTATATDPAGNTSELSSCLVVTPVNTAPSFTTGADQATNEDAGAQSVANWATNISAGPPSESSQTVQFLVSNDNAALFAVQPAVTSGGTLTYTPAADGNGLATVTVRIQDDGGTAGGGVDTSAPQTFTIAVAAVNDAPSFTKGSDQIAIEDAGPQSIAGWATAIAAGPTDEGGQTLTFLTSATNGGLFLSAPSVSASGTLTFTPAPNTSGTAIVTVQLQDSGGGSDTSAPQTFAITVTANSGSGQLAALLSNNSPLPLSNRFGVPDDGVVNDAGDHVFFNGVAAIFQKKAGTLAPIRIWEGGDPIPGIADSRSHQIISGVHMNGSGQLAFSLDFALPDGQVVGSALFHDGTTLNTIVASSAIAPGTGGLAFDRFIRVRGLNDAGDVFFDATVNGAVHLFVSPSAGSPVHVAGPGDPAPGTNGSFGVITAGAMNNQGDILFSSTITGGTGGNGLFLWRFGTVEKVVATGDAGSGGPFAAIGAGMLNSAGQVAFAAQNGIWVHTPGSGYGPVALPGSPAPAPIGGSFSTTSAMTLAAFDALGQTAFTGTVTGSAVSTFGLFRTRPGGLIDAVAWRSQSAPSGGGQLFNNFTAISMNGAGTISFRGDNPAGGPIGIFQQVVGGTLDPAILNGSATPLGGTFSLGVGGRTNRTQTLTSGSVYFAADVRDVAADYGEFLWTAGTTSPLMTTADTLPSGGRVLLAERVFGFSAAGDWVGFHAGYAGGKLSLFVHRVSTHSTFLLTNEESTVPGVGGRIRFQNISGLTMNGNGQVALRLNPVGGPNHLGSFIFLATPGVGLAPLVSDGDLDVDGRVLTAPTFTESLISRVLNNSGQLVFNAVVNGGARGVFVGTIGGPPVKLAVNGDLTSAGIAITSAVVGTHAINEAGQSAFTVNTSVGNTLLVGTAGSVSSHIARVGEASPGGGTFAGFATPSFNNLGQVAFMATVTGGPAGVFLGAPGAPPVAIALDGAASPAGGTFSFPVQRSEAQVNDQQDVLVVAELAGGPASAAIFVRRGSNGTLQTVAAQGQPAPGTTSAFDGFTHVLNNRPGEFSQLGPAGEIAFQATYMAGGVSRTGQWNVRLGGTIEPIILRGVGGPEFEGGVPVIITQATQWLSAGRYPTVALVAGGAMSNGIFVFTSTNGAALGIGTNVAAAPTDSTTQTTPLTATFDAIMQPGVVSLTTSGSGPALPANFAAGTPPVFYTLQTTASFTGQVTVCIDFTGTTFPAGFPLRVLQLVSGAWQDVTFSGPSGNQICGRVSLLSTLTIAAQTSLPSPPPDPTFTADDGDADWLPADRLQPRRGIGRQWVSGSRRAQFQKPGVVHTRRWQRP